MLFLLWTVMWAVYVLLLCGVSVKQYGGLWEMFTRYPPVCITQNDNLSLVRKTGLNW